MPKSATATVQIVTAAELTELSTLEREYSRVNKQLNDLERRTKAARLSLAQKVLGVATAEEFKALTPEQVDERMADRELEKLWKSEKKAPPFVFIKTWEGRQPSWREEFIKLKSEAEAERVTAETAKTYAYRVDVAV